MSANTVVPSESQEEQIRELYRLIEAGTVKLVGADGGRVDLPEAVHRLLVEILRNLQAGNAVSLVGENQQLSTQKAADLLGVSRPFLVKLLEEGEIPFHKVGKHRRILLRDLTRYQRRRDAERRAALNQMARRTYEEDYYDVGGIPADGED